MFCLVEIVGLVADRLIFGHVENGLIRKIRLISTFIAPQPGKQTIAIHTLPNISRSMGNQTMKFGQSIEHNMRNIFLEKSYTKCGGETIPKNFSKKSRWKISLVIVKSHLYLQLLKYHFHCYVHLFYFLNELMGSLDQ